MSVLTVTGTALPDRTLDYSQISAATNNRIRPSPALVANDLPSYTRAVANKVQPGTPTSHRHSRTVSSSISPADRFAIQPTESSSRRQSQHPAPSLTSPPTHSRQSSVSVMSMQRQATTGSNTSAPRRSTSFRSTTTNGPTSYVALMRKQKATVWCDRSQSIDARTAAAQKAAKQRAVREVVGTNSTGRTSTITSGGVVGKIRHGGVPKAGVYVPPNMSGASVPMRLSANEMLGDDEVEGRSLGDNAMTHARTGSGKSSINSAKYRSGYPRVDQGRFSTNSTPTEGSSPGKEGIPEETSGDRKQTYFDSDNIKQLQATDSEDSFGEFKELSGPSATQRATQQKQTAEDLRRRGSVDERAMSMGTGVRLFVANPDLDDN